MRILLDFRTKRSYAPVIDLANELSKKFDVFLIPNRMSKPVGLNNNVVCCRSVDARDITFDVVFSTYSTLLAIAYLKKKLKLPIVNYMFIYMMMHDVLSTSFLALPNSYKVREILKFVALPLPKSLLMPDRLIVPNLIVEKELIKLGFPEDKMIILPWGLNITRYKPREFSLPYLDSLTNNNKDVIFYTGPLHPLRFSTQLLHTFSEVVKQNIDIHLLLLFREDLWHQRTYKELISFIRRLALEKNVSIMISPSRETYLSCVARATVVILPYFSSGIVEMPPFTLLECMALSKPVITSHGIATYGIIEDRINGFIIPKNPSSLAELIISLISDKRKAHHVGQKARMFVSEKYSLTDFSSKLSYVLESCCE